jgi:hypothetical protein
MSALPQRHCHQEGGRFYIRRFALINAAASNVSDFRPARGIWVVG